MAEAKVIIVTGASQGIGLAISNFLLRASHKVVAVARTAEPLEALAKQYPGQVEVVAADLADFPVGEKVIAAAIKAYSRIDGLVLCHGTLGTVRRVADTTAEDWRSTFDTNFFSCIALVKAALPSLRATKGRVVLISSGAAAGAYSTWGPYGSSKAAMNHLALTLGVEERDITTVAVRPGKVDTAMQQAIREDHSTHMDEKDWKSFRQVHADGKLLKPEQPGNVCARLVLEAGSELSGKFLSWDAPELKSFQR